MSSRTVRQDFVAQVLPSADYAERHYGVSANGLVCLAAYETQYGESQVTHPDGSPANNLFNLPAKLNWPGDVVLSLVDMEVGGTRVRRNYAFRAYPTVTESMLDFARKLKTEPKYAGAALANGPHQLFVALRAIGHLPKTMNDRRHQNWCIASTMAIIHALRGLDDVNHPA